MGWITDRFDILNILSVMIEGIVAVPLVLTQILSIPESSLTHVARDVDPLHVFGLDVTFDGSLLTFLSTNLAHIDMFEGYPPSTFF